MAKKKTNKDKKIEGRREIKRLWKLIPVPEWLALFQEISPESSWNMEGKNSIKGRCPYHDDGSPSFHLSFTKCMGKCFGETCEKVVVDLVAFVAKMRHCSYTEALLFLNDRWDLSEKISINSDELNQYNNIMELKKQVAVASNNVLIEVLRDDPDHLDYCRPALIYLLEARKLPRKTLHLLPVGVYAKPLHMKKYIDPKFHESFDKYFEKYQSNGFWGALMFYYNDSPGSITRFKLRLRNLDVPKENPTKANLTKLDAAKQRELYKREFAYVEDPYTTKLGVFGLYKYQRLLGNNNANAYLTEGEFDVLSVMAAQDNRYTDRFMILGTGGKGGTSIGFLREFGVRTAWLVPDHPTKNGDDWALSILADKSNFAADANNRPLELKVFQWPITLNGLDLDDAVQFSGYEQVLNCLVRNRRDYFLNYVPWINGKCDEELKEVKQKYDAELSVLDIEEGDVSVQRDNLLDERKRAIQDVLLRWYRYMVDTSDRANFVQTYDVSENIDLSQIENVNQQIRGLDSYEGVVTCVANALEEYFSPGYYDGKGSGMKTSLWAKKKHEIFEVVMDEQKMFHQLPIYLGCRPIHWLDKLLGDNEVYLSGTEKLPHTSRERAKRSNALMIIRDAFSEISTKLSRCSSLTTHDQGIHFYGLPNRIQNQNIMYFANGKNVFKGRFTDEPGKMEWEPLNSMVDFINDIGIRFTGISSGIQWSHVEDVSDLYAAHQVDLRDVYNKIRTILRGWKFKHHEVVEPYLAAYIMSLPIMAAVGNINITVVTGEAESGKTSLVAGLLGGLQTGGANYISPILESAIMVNNSTPAAMYQTFDCSALTFVLDEFEAYQADMRKDRNNDELTRMTYGMPMGTVAINRGGLTKDGTVMYKMRMPMIMSAINTPSNATFLSRVMLISTVKDPKREALSMYINRHFSDGEIADLRKAITVGLIPHIPEIIKIIGQLQIDLPEIDKSVDSSATNRFEATVQTPLAIYQLLGYNAHELYRGIINCYKGQLESISSQDSRVPLLDTCLYSKAIKVPTQDMISDFVTAKSLIDDGEFGLLNSNGCGIYYLQDYDWIIIVWRQVKYTILKGTSFGNREETALKEQVSKSKYVIHDINREQHEFIQYHLGLSDVHSPADYSVVRREYLIKTRFMRKGKARVAPDVYGPNDEPPVDIYDDDSGARMGFEI